MERPKITEKDNVRLLFLTAWSLEFFLAARLKNGADSNVTGYAMVKEVVEEEWVKWVLKRMREAADDKVGANSPRFKDCSLMLDPVAETMGGTASGHQLPDPTCKHITLALASTKSLGSCHASSCL